MYIQKPRGPYYTNYTSDRGRYRRVVLLSSCCDLVATVE